MGKTYDRSEIMRAAWKQWRYANARGWHIGDDPWTFAACLRLAHAAAAKRKSETEAFHAKGRDKRRRDFLFLQAA